ncbi:MAG: VOC family protein [bacterium]
MSDFQLNKTMTIDVGVSDLAKSKAWYCDIMGCAVIFEVAEYGYIFLSTPNPDITIGMGQVEEVKVAGGVTPTWNCQNIEAGKTLWEGKGVRFDGPVRDLGMVKLVTFYDPDGYPWMLAENVPPPQ